MAGAPSGFNLALIFVFFFCMCQLGWSKYEKQSFVICLHFDSLIELLTNATSLSVMSDVIIIINSRNILRTFLGWQSLMRNYLVMHVSLN
jgi:hypothetical protein